MAANTKRAREIAAALTKIDGVLVVPDPPQTPMMHIALRTTENDFNAGVRRLATEQRLWSWSASYPGDVPGYRWVELYVGDATLELAPAEIAAAIRALMAARD